MSENIRWENLDENPIFIKNKNFITMSSSIINFPSNVNDLIGDKVSVYYSSDINKFKIIKDENGLFEVKFAKGYKSKKIYSIELVKYINEKLGQTKKVPFVIEKDYIIMG